MSFYTQKLYLARHGERSDLNDVSWFSQRGGRSNLPFDPQLSIRGILQAKDLGTFLADKCIKAIYTAPFLSTVQTATYACKEISDEHMRVNVTPLVADCLSCDIYPNENPLNRLLPVKYLKSSLGDCVHTATQNLSTPSPTYPESLPLMYERCRTFIKKLLNVHKRGESVMIVSHSSVIEAITTCLIEGYTFPRGITFASLTEIDIQRKKRDGREERDNQREEGEEDEHEVLSCKIARLADDSFLKFPEFEKGVFGYKFPARTFPPPRTGWYASCCNPEFDEWEEERLVVEEYTEEAEMYAKSASLLEIEGGEEGTGGQIAQKSSQEIKINKEKLQKLEQCFFALAGKDNRLPLDKAVFLAHYLGFAPSNAEISAARAASGDTQSFGGFLNFLKKSLHPEDQVEDVCAFFQLYDPHNTGSVSLVTMKNFLSVFGEPLNAEEIELARREFEVSNGRVAYRPFVEKMLNKTSGMDLSLSDFEHAGVSFDSLDSCLNCATEVEPAGELSPLPLRSSILSEEEEEKQRKKQEKQQNILSSSSSASLQICENAYVQIAGNLQNTTTQTQIIDIANLLQITIHPKELNDFKLQNGEEFTYESFQKLLSFIADRRHAFSVAAGDSGTIHIHDVSKLGSGFGLDERMSAYDVSHFAGVCGSRLNYTTFAKFADFVEKRHQTFSASAVSKGSSGEDLVLAESCGFLANQFGFAPSKAEVEELQKNAGEKINYEQFMQFITHTAHPSLDLTVNILPFFQHFDERGSGCVSKKVLRNLLFMFGESYTQQQLDVIIKELANDEDPVNYREFINRMLSPVENDIAVNPAAAAAANSSSSSPHDDEQTNKQQNMPAGGGVQRGDSRASNLNVQRNNSSINNNNNNNNNVVLPAGSFSQNTRRSFNNSNEEKTPQNSINRQYTHTNSTSNNNNNNNSNKNSGGGGSSANLKNLSGSRTLSSIKKNLSLHKSFTGGSKHSSKHLKSSTTEVREEEQHVDELN